jgi:bacillithiol biosynthesis deacetylase BshB1
MDLDILAFAAHPDDVELCCSGTLIKHALKGQKTGIIDLTRGELGTRGTAEIRSSESAAASVIMKLAARENLGMSDGFFEPTKENKIAIVRMIRKYRPRIILANAISDRHPDHGRASKLVTDSCFLSGLLKVETELDGKVQEPWRPKAIYHYIQDRFMEPSFIVDISEVMEQRNEAIRAYSSQFYDPDSTEPETVISTRQFFDSLSARALELGRVIGVDYGEGFVKERIPGINDLDDLK